MIPCVVLDAEALAALAGPLSRNKRRGDRGPAFLLPFVSGSGRADIPMRKAQSTISIALPDLGPAPL